MTTSFLSAPSPATIYHVISDHQQYQGHQHHHQQPHCLGDHHLANWSPDTSLGVGALPQVVLLEPLPSVLKSREGLDHGEVGGKLKNILGEALFGDGGPSLLGHLAQPAGKSSSSSSTSSLFILIIVFILILII